jgi:hypothetical protein
MTKRKRWSNKEYYDYCREIGIPEEAIRLSKINDILVVIGFSLGIPTLLFEIYLLITILV